MALGRVVPRRLAIARPIGQGEEVWNVIWPGSARKYMTE